MGTQNLKLVYYGSNYIGKISYIMPQMRENFFNLLILKINSPKISSKCEDIFKKKIKRFKINENSPTCHLTLVDVRSLVHDNVRESKYQCVFTRDFGPRAFLLFYILWPASTTYHKEKKIVSSISNNKRCISKI